MNEKPQEHGYKVKEEKSDKEIQTLFNIDVFDTFSNPEEPQYGYHNDKDGL